MEDLYSVRADIWAQKDPTERLAAVNSMFDRTARDLTELFERYEGVRTDLELAGLVVQAKFIPILEAAYGAWLRDRDVPRRLPLTELSEAPLPPEDGFPLDPRAST